MKTDISVPDMLNQYENFLEFYNTPLKGTGYLAFRDLQSIINSSAETVLDFGCGAGRSSSYLRALGLKVTGTDINANLLKHALNPDGTIQYVVMNKGLIPFADESFDLVFNSFVLSDMASQKELEVYFKEMKRVCKKNGLVVSVTNSDYLFQKNWLTVKNYPQNAALTDGDVAQIYLSDVDVVLYDYFWSEKTFVLP